MKTACTAFIVWAWETVAHERAFVAFPVTVPVTTVTPSRTQREPASLDRIATSPSRMTLSLV